MKDLFEQLMEEPDPSRSPRDALADRFSEVFADASEALGKRTLQPIEVAAVLKLYDAVLRLSTNLSQVRTILSSAQPTVESSPNDQTSLSSPERQVFQRFFEGVRDFDHALDSIDLAIVDIFYPGLAAALHRSASFDMHFHDYFNRMLVPQFGLTREDVPASLKRLINRFDDRWDYRRSHDLLESLPSSFRRSDEPITEEALAAVSDVCDSIQRCRVEVARLVRETWSFRELTDAGTFRRVSVEVTMGDKFENVSQSTVINKSQVDQSFTETSSISANELTEMLTELATIIAATRNHEAAEQFEAFREEAERERPRKAVLQTLWTSITALLPSIEKAADVVAKVVRLVGA